MSTIDTRQSVDYPAPAPRDDVTEQERLRERLAEAELQYHRLIEHLPAAIYMQPVGPARAHAQFISPRIEAITGYPASVWAMNTDFWDTIIHPDDRHLREAALAEIDATRGARPYLVEYRIIGPDGRITWVRNEAIVVHDDDGTPLYWQGYVTDITARKEAELALQTSEQRLRDLIENIPAVTYTYILDRETGKATMHHSRQLEPWTGYTVEEMDTMDSALGLIHPDDRERVAAEAARTDGTGEPYHLEHRMLTKDGRVLWVRNDALLARRDGRYDIWQGFYSDISDRKQLELQLAHQVFHDGLTGLPNRVLFAERIEHALARSGRHGRRVGVLFVDLDGFKQVNDSAGHRVGDELLIGAGQRLLTAVRPGDTVARMGGDEFTILLDELQSLEEARAVAERVLDALTPAFNIDDRTHTVAASIGIALSEGPNDSAADLIRRADLAMYDAKSRGKARWALFNDVPR